jgi:hypothetical protein
LRDGQLILYHQQLHIMPVAIKQFGLCRKGAEWLTHTGLLTT